MISKVSIRNYQSLKTVDLELGRFTLIVGESDSGKSALVRALYAWARNQSGTSFVTSGAKSTSVLVALDSGEEVSWHKPKNEYRIGDKTYSKAGRDAPDEVKTLTGFIDVVFDDDYVELLNFAHQFDPPFLLSSSGSRIAKVLGKVSGIEYLFNSQRIASRELLQVRTNLRSAEEQKDQITVELKQFESLDEDAEKVQRIVKALDLIDLDQQKCDTLRDVITVIEQRQESISVLDAKIGSFPELPNLDKLSLAFQTLIDLSSEIVAIQKSQEKIVTLKSQLDKVQSDLLSSEQELHSFMEQFEICPFCERAME